MEFASSAELSSESEQGQIPTGGRAHQTPAQPHPSPSAPHGGLGILGASHSPLSSFHTCLHPFMTRCCLTGACPCTACTILLGSRATPSCPQLSPGHPGTLACQQPQTDSSLFPAPIPADVNDPPISPPYPGSFQMLALPRLFPEICPLSPVHGEVIPHHGQPASSSLLTDFSTSAPAATPRLPQTSPRPFRECDPHHPGPADRPVTPHGHGLPRRPTNALNLSAFAGRLLLSPQNSAPYLSS